MHKHIYYIITEHSYRLLFVVKQQSVRYMKSYPDKVWLMAVEIDRMGTAECTEGWYETADLRLITNMDKLFSIAERMYENPKILHHVISLYLAPEQHIFVNVYDFTKDYVHDYYYFPGFNKLTSIYFSKYNVIFPNSSFFKSSNGIELRTPGPSKPVSPYIPICISTQWCSMSISEQANIINLISSHSDENITLGMMLLLTYKV